MSIAGQFCGQMQPHAAHTWLTPETPIGVFSIRTTYQCAGLTTPLPEGEGAKE